MRRPRRRANGFTLPELMAVVAIVGVMGAVAMATLNGASSGQNAAALARSLQFAMMNARSSALSDGAQHRLSCTLAATSYAGSCDVREDVPRRHEPGDHRLHARVDRGVAHQLRQPRDRVERRRLDRRRAANNAGASQVTGTKTITSIPTARSDVRDACNSTGLYVSDTEGREQHQPVQDLRLPGDGDGATGEPMVRRAAAARTRRLHAHRAHGLDGACRRWACSACWRCRWSPSAAT